MKTNNLKATLSAEWILYQQYQLLTKENTSGITVSLLPHEDNYLTSLHVGKTDTIIGKIITGQGVVIDCMTNWMHILPR